MKAIKFLSMMLCLVVSMGFISCSDDDDDAPGASIVGEWEGDYYEDGYPAVLWAEFYSNGKFEAESETYEDGYGYDSYYISGNYTLSGNRLTLSTGEETMTATVLSLTESELVIKDEEGTVTLYRVE